MLEMIKKSLVQYNVVVIQVKEQVNNLMIMEINYKIFNHLIKEYFQMIKINKILFILVLKREMGYSIMQMF